MLSPSDIKEKILAPDDPKIIAAREMNDKLLLHVEGVGLQKYLSRINNYENNGQFEARKKHAISNKFVTEELLRPCDNAFNARGGSKNYKFKSSESEEKEKDFTQKLANIKKSHSLSWYVENEWFNKFITDPNGLIVIESDDASVKPENRSAYPSYKSIYAIKQYQQNGVFVNWVVFEKHETKIVEEKKAFQKTKKSEIDYHWAVDEKNWYLIERQKEEVEITKTLPHNFGKVPAMLCSDIVDNVTGWKKSPIDAQVELLDRYVLLNSTLTLTEFTHIYLQQYIYVDDCVHCEGTGTLQAKDGDRVCPHCHNGMFNKKDPTDLIRLRIPNKDEVAIDPPGGFIYPPHEPLGLMYKANDRGRGMIFFSHWGTYISKDDKYASATGRYIDAQPVNNRLNKYSKSIERAHTVIANFIGKYHYPSTFNEAFIQYGRRYLIETPDQIWEKYLNAKTQKAPTTTLDILLHQYLESEFRENETMYIVETKKVKLEPFIHWDIATVRSSEVIPVKDKLSKEFFNDWIQTKTIEEIYEKEVGELKKELMDFVSGKEDNNKKED